MNRLTSRERRTFRTRRSIRTTVDNGRARLSVFRSAKFIYAQVIDDTNGVTLAEANSRTLGADGDKTAQANHVGKLLAERALAAGIKRVVFDRGPFRYHGRVKALADGAREGGLEF